MSNVEVIEFTDNSVIVTVFIDDANILNELRDVWKNKVQGIQPPLVEGRRNGFNVFIPWILKGAKPDE